MGSYLIRRLIHGIISIIIVIFIVMVLVYGLMDKTLIFANDSNYTKLSGTQRTTYMYQQWENYGYLDYVPYTDYLSELLSNGEITDEEYDEAKTIASTAAADEGLAAEYIVKFTEYYESKGYTVTRIEASRSSSRTALFAYKNYNVFQRLWNYFTGIIEVDNIYYASGIDDSERGLTFTLFDPVYNTDENGNLTKTTFSPAIIGNGTYHKYLLYFDSSFPFIHQNLVTISLGSSYSVYKGVDVWTTMTDSSTQGNLVSSETVFPTGVTASTSYDLHSATYSEGSLSSSSYNQNYYTDDYTVMSSTTDGMSKMAYSFIIGIIAVIIAYLVGIPLGIVMARRHNGLVDKIGTIYIVFIMAVPSLAYIFMFQAIGRLVGLPTSFSLTSPTTLMWILPIVSLALPSIANLMKWMRRYMIDQRNSDYVKFARAGGLSEGEISRKHIMKNAAIPLVHGIPGSVLGALTGALITERVYSVPGVGSLLTDAINAYDNSVIVGVTLFYAVLSVVAIILGDLLMALMDPRISFSSKKEKR